MAKTQTVTISLEEYRELLLKGKPSDRDHEILERILIEFEKNIVYSDYKYDSGRIGEDMKIENPTEVCKEIMQVIRYLDFDRFMKIWNRVRTNERKRKDMEAQIEQMNKAKEMRNNE